MRLWLALRAFFAVLFQPAVAREVSRILGGEPQRPASATESREQKEAMPRAASPARSDAVTLLAALQREARLVDIVREPLAEYTDAQIGAAARDVLRDTGRVLDRFFGLEPMVQLDEGHELETPAAVDPGRFRITGNVSGNPPFRGRLIHHGWQATRCELPIWSGSREAALVVAPIELEV
jgi:hypothetical protein